MITTGGFFVLRTGCPWRSLPREDGPWQRGSYSFRHWRRTGTWLQSHPRLRAWARVHAGGDPTPSAAISERQSVKTLSGGVRGCDGARKLAGRKRHLLVATQGGRRSVVGPAADRQERQGGRLVLAAGGAHFPRCQPIWADHGSTSEIHRWAAER